MSESIARYGMEADTLGYTGEERTKYIKECLREERQMQAEKEERERQMRAEERERQTRAEKEERERQMRAEERERERQVEERRMQMQAEKEERERQMQFEEREREYRRELEREEKQRQHELELEKLRLQHSGLGSNTSIGVSHTSRLPKLPAYVDHKDDLDSFLTRFERFSEMSGWPKEEWPTHLSALLTGRALDCFCRLSTEEARDYDVVKEALQRRYNLTEDGYRVMFRQCKPEDGEDPSMFVVRLRTYLDRWVKLSDTKQEYDDICDLFVREQFMDASPTDLAIHLREKKLRTVDQLAKEADAFLMARNRKLNGKKQAQQTSNVSMMKNDSAKKESLITCFKCNKIGHRAVDCRTGTREVREIRCYRCQKNGHTSKNCPQAEIKQPTNNRPNRAAAAVVVAAEDAIPLCSQNVESAYSVMEEVKDGKLKLASGKSVPVITNCGACGDVKPVDELRLPVMRGLVEDKPADVLRDTGCDGVIVRRALVNDGQLTGKKCLIARIDNTMLIAEEAWINVRTPYLTGRVKALCIPESICDLVIGNVDGARNPDDPDTNVIVGAVTTRTQAKKDGRVAKKLAVPKIERHVGVDRSELIKLQMEDQAIQDMARSTTPKIKRGKTVFFERRHGVVFRVYQDDVREVTMRQVVLPRSLRNYVMSVAHDSITGGHQGIRKTKDKVISNFYWPGVEGDVTRYCRSCDVCQKTVNKGATPRAPLQSIPAVDVPFKRVAVDLIGPIEPSSEEGHRYILTLVDFATRYPEAVPLKRIDTETVAEALVNLYSRIGVPEEILSDQGTQFISDCMKEVNRLLGITQSTTTPYHPMCNGLVEKYNGTLKKALRRLCVEQPRQWHRFINPVLFAYREVPQESTKFAPFELLYGRSVRGPMHILKQLWTEDIEEEEVRSSYQYVLELRERLEETWKIAKQELEKAQGKQKRYYDRGTKTRNFKPGDKVLVLLPTESNKLLMQWKGPYEISSVVGMNDYKVKMAHKEKTLHVNLLKRYIEREGEELPNNASVGVTNAKIEEKIDFQRASESRKDLLDSQLKCAGGVAVIEDEVGGDDSVEDMAELGNWFQKESVEDIVFGKQLKGEELVQVKTVITNYQNIFSDLPGNTSVAEHRIDLTCETPIRQKPYNVPFAMRDSLRQELQTMEKLGIIRKSSSSFAAPVVVVTKKDGSNRICIDYRRLNKVTVFDPHPTTPPADVFQGLARDKYFSKIDLSKGYWQIPVRREDIPKTAFVTMDVHYEFVRMPFGMMNSGATLTRAVKSLLHGMNNVTAYVDDILVHTESFEYHLDVLEELFRRLSEANITIRPSKCVLASTEVEFVGHWLGRGTITLQEDNVAKVKDAPRPKTKKEVRAFLGLMNYYRNFVPNFAAIASPLSDLVRKGKPNVVVWDEPQEKSYVSLKRAITSRPILRLPDVNKPFVIRTDASELGLGAVLLQSSDDDDVLFPVAYASRKLLDREKNYSTTEKECLAIIWGIRKFSLYLYGRQFVLQTDHLPLQYLNAAKFENPRVMRWALYLQSYNFKVDHIKGSENLGADYLSRVTL